MLAPAPAPTRSCVARLSPLAFTALATVAKSEQSRLERSEGMSRPLLNLRTE
jgi:hypothetical protein